MTYYVYQYMENGFPYYIGMGHGNRAYDPHRGQRVPKDKSQIEIVKSNLSEKDALKLERELTELYGLKIDGTGILENKIHGGHASPRGMLGKKLSAESRQKISEGNTGKIRSEEQRKNYRKPKTKEHAENIRKANMGRLDDGRNQKISETKKGKPWTQARRDAFNRRVK